MKLSPSIVLVSIANIFCIALMLLQAFWPFPLYDGTNAVFERIDIFNSCILIINDLFLAYLIYYFKQNKALSILFAVLVAIGLLQFVFAPGPEDLRVVGLIGPVLFVLPIVILVLGLRIQLLPVRFSVLLITIVLISTGLLNSLSLFVIVFFSDRLDVDQATFIVNLFSAIVVRLSFVFGFMKLKQAL